MKIQIEVRSTEVREQITKSDKKLHWQQVGFQEGEDFPVVFDLFLPNGVPLKIGKHTIDLALKADQWRSLVVDPFNTKVVAQ